MKTSLFVVTLVLGSILALGTASSANAGWKKPYYTGVDPDIQNGMVTPPVENVVPEQNDPIEPLNRAIFRFNEAIDKMVLQPTVRFYRLIVPSKGRTMVTNVVKNLAAPVSVTNTFLQGNYEDGMHGFWRFVINSTMGIGGMFDVAQEAGMEERHEEDFGQTFGAYGIGQGPYLMLPLLGPSNPRDLVGKVLDIVFSPFNHIDSDEFQITHFTLYVLDTRESLLDPVDTIYSTSLDPYASIRSMYIQQRVSKVANQ